tara:strand:- start:1458 stop:1667 length:210 start_codon:yes stop_codon:yes gene_type:complete
MKYYISHVKNGNQKFIVLTSKFKMLDYLNSNKSKLNKLEKVYLHFNQIKISLSQSSWRIKNKKSIDKQN